jgi:hypothetical protein
MIQDDAPQQHGRAAAGESPSIGVQMSSEELAALDEWRRQQADRPSRAEAIRLLVGKALDAEGQPKGEKGPELATGYIKGDELTSENDGGASR